MTKRGRNIFPHFSLIELGKKMKNEWEKNEKESHTQRGI
jgi:hypothetical protein